MSLQAVPSVVGAPGGVELLVVLLVSLVLFSPLLALVYLLLFRERASGTDERVAELESEVADLRERLDARADDEGSGTDDGADDGGAGSGVNGEVDDEDAGE